MQTITRRLFSASFLAISFGAAFLVPAMAQDLTPLRVLYSPSPDYTAAQVALTNGIFKKHGLEVSLSPYVASNTTSVNMLQSRSVDITVLTPSALLQTTDAGLDLVLVYGGAMLPSEHKWGVFARKDSGVQSAKDFEGKTFGMIITTGAFEIFFHNWMEQNGADPSKVNLVQVPLSSMADFLTSQKIDGGIVATPFLEDVIEKSGATLVGDIA